jgi:hypothetical protein
MRLFPEPEDKRQMARSIGSFHPEHAVAWFAAAELQQFGGEEDYERAMEAWKAAKPQPEQFATDEARERIEAFRKLVEARAKREFERTWGALMGQYNQSGR